MRKRWIALWMTVCLMGSQSVAFAQEVGEDAGQEAQEMVQTEILTIEDSGETLPAGENPGMGLAAYSLNGAAYQDSYGQQLQGDALTYYQSMESAYAQQKETDGITIADCSIRFTPTISGGSIVKDDAYEEARTELSVALQEAGDAFLYDHPEVFWIRTFQYSWYISANWNSTSGTYEASFSNITVQPTEYYSGAAAEVGAYDAAVDEVALTVQENRESDGAYGTLKTIHDYLCGELSYNYLAAASDSDEYRYAHTSSTAFIGSKSVVCEGYAKAFKVLCDRMGIPCALISGISNNGSSEGSHMWNVVKISGKWYAVDVTWDDMTEIRYDYFLSGSETVAAGKSLTFAQSHIGSGDFSNSGKVTFALPVLEEEALTEEPEEDEESNQFGSVSVSGVTETNAYISATLNNRPYVTSCGFYLSTDGASFIKAAEKTVNGNLPAISYDIETDYQALSPETTYYYKFYYNTSSGRYFESPVGSFTTSKPEGEIEYSQGDVNEDGEVNIRDCRILLQALCEKLALDERQSQLADVTDNGEVDIQDLRRILLCICGKLAVDEL